MCNVRIRLPATSDRQFGSPPKTQYERRMVLSGLLVPVSPFSPLDAMKFPVFSRIIRLSVETIRRLTGTRPIGWYIGMPSANTRRLVVEEGGFLYDSDAYNDELPYWTYDYGRPHLIIPHTLDDNDTRLGRGLGWGQAEDFFVSLRDNFDAPHREGEQTPKMMTVALHCRLAGKPARAAAVARFVDHILRHHRVWICQRNEIA